ncbi:MAG: hypothetical protein CL678_08590 [Bdellovibrionaceae bacterium]|nr:hypothetical protein [Pseudobdellovibrionaceae bacterium]
MARGVYSWPSFKFREDTNNRKTGHIPVTYSNADTCPPSCELGQQNICYAKGGPTRMIWDRMETPINYQAMKDSFYSMVFDLEYYIKKAKRHHWNPRIRGNITGDLPSKKGDRELINLRMVTRLSKAVKNARFLLYTHYRPTYGLNGAAIATMNSFEGMTVNLSANTLDQAVEYKKLGVAPVTVVLPHDHNKKVTYHKGEKIVTCKYDWDGTQCKWCTICWWKDRDFIVGFRGHGMNKRKHKNVFYRGSDNGIA